VPPLNFWSRGSSQPVVLGVGMNAIEDQFTFSEEAIRCFKTIGVHEFSNPLSSHPWGGRAHVLKRRYILQKYLTNEDVIRARWIHQRVRRADSDWFAKDPGMSYLAGVMDERSEGRWREEVEDFGKQLPNVVDYMEEEWGEVTRSMLSQHRASDARRRRGEMHLVERSLDEPQETENADKVTADEVEWRPIPR